MCDLKQKVQCSFEKKFKYSPSFFFRAPGRVNLIGEHTDYNDGFVLPCAIDFDTIIAVSKRKDTIIRILSIDYDFEIDIFDFLDEIVFCKDYLWKNYIRGVIKILKEKEYQIKGLDIAISGNIPQGAGLSSSASLEVVIVTMIKELFDLTLNKKEIALIGQQAENEFVGCNCGIMDQMISSTALKNHATLLDCRSLVPKLVKIPDDLTIMIVNSNQQRGLVDSEYNIRREQCEKAADTLKVKALRDASIDQLNQYKDQMDPIVYKRAKHVITENKRTISAAYALQMNNIQILSDLMKESHFSMKNNFEITTYQIDYLVSLIQEVIGNFGGVRMTGGGFGGCVVAIMPDDLVEKVQLKIKDNYQKMTGLQESIYICKAQDGASEIC